MKLGTHNSLSYLPCQWYFKPFNFMAKCQNLTITEQYNLGVRYFDIRVKYNKNNIAKSGHGLASYNVLIDDVLDLLEQQNEKVIVRLFLENNFFNPTKHDEIFKKDIDKWMNKYKNITFVNGGCRYKWKAFVPQSIEVEICHAEYWKMKFCIPFPLYWAKRNNMALKAKMNDELYSIFDFVEY